MTRLTARDDGWLSSERPVRLPIMAPRLQGEADAGVVELALWGAGQLGRVRFTPLTGPFVHAPNLTRAPRGGVYAAQSAPAIAIRGARLTHLRPASRRAPWAPPAATPARVVRDGQLSSAELGWASLAAEQRGEDLVVAAGADGRELAAALALPIDEIVRQAEAHAARCDVLPTGDSELRSMAVQAAHAALSAARRTREGRFAGLAAGLAYGLPARTYYRDAYWTCQTLLQLEPAAAAEAVDLLADGVREDGEAPSGLILARPARDDAWEAARTADPALAVEHLRPREWWSDHFDSPLLFVLLLADHARATGDRGRFEAFLPKVRAVFERYQGFARSGGGLPVKPREARDWADNVLRGGLVAYDLGLWIGALGAIVEFGAALDPDLAARARAAARSGRAAIEAALWRPTGWYADYAAPDGAWTEDHLSLDSLTLLRFGAVSEARAAAVLAAARARLETRRNADQPYGDWGVMCAWPPYGRRSDLRGKSAFAFRYHNGGDWPWLDGLYAGERLRRGLAGWRYPLTRWWRACLERGWLGAVEHLSPVYGRGSPIQAWSSLPLAAALEHQAVVLAGDPEPRLG